MLDFHEKNFNSQSMAWKCYVKKCLSVIFAKFFKTCSVYVYTRGEVYAEPSQTSKTKLFGKIVREATTAGVLQ